MIIILSNMFKNELIDTKLSFNRIEYEHFLLKFCDEEYTINL
jgi:hypothetical protein